jgi:hypothetical protein
LISSHSTWFEATCIENFFTQALSFFIRKIDHNPQGSRSSFISFDGKICLLGMSQSALE